MRNAVVRDRLLVAVLLAAVMTTGSLAATPDKALPEPFLDRQGIDVKAETYGDARSVSLLAAVLGEDDATAREQAVRCLGETHNAAAVEHILGAMKDADPTVRAAGAAAAAEFDAAKSAPIVLAAISDADRHVVLTALRTARLMRLTSATEKIAQLLSQPEREPLVKTVAIQTLTEFGKAAGIDQLVSLASESSAAVRLRAAENAALATGDEKELAALAEAMKRLAEGASLPVRAAAVAALGRLDPAGAADLIEANRREANPLLRRAALRACCNSGRPEQIRTFLDDESPLVVLEATRSAGRFKRTECAERLCGILLAAPDADLHEATIESLHRLGPAAVASRAARALRKQVEQFRPAIPKSNARVPGSASEKRPEWTPGQVRLNRNIGLPVQAAGAAQERYGVRSQTRAAEPPAHRLRDTAPSCRVDRGPARETYNNRPLADDAAEALPHTGIQDAPGAAEASASTRRVLRRSERGGNNGDGVRLA